MRRIASFPDFREAARLRLPRFLFDYGVLDPEDAREAARIGADGIVVSNHGGRQLDGVSSTAHALAAIAAAVGEQLTVLVDFGVRSGLDIIRMLALGAKGVLWDEHGSTRLPRMARRALQICWTFWRKKCAWQ